MAGLRRDPETGEMVASKPMVSLGDAAAAVVDKLQPIDPAELDRYFAEVTAELTGEEVTREEIARRLDDAALGVMRQVIDARTKAWLERLMTEALE